MKKELIIIISLFFIIQFVSATDCNLNATLINQDPYPAIPGDYVKLVFQVSGVENPECNGAKVELLDEYPISFDLDISKKIEINSGTYTYNYNSYLMVPYKVRVDQDAIDGNNPIKLIFSSGDNRISIMNLFNLEIKNVKTDFEVYVKNYNYETNIITFEVLNIGKNNVEAVTIEIPQQESITVKGPRSNIIGDLDNNEYSTGDFEAIPNSKVFNIKIRYTDTAEIRREQTYEIIYEKDLFENRKTTEESASWTTYLIVIIILIVGFFIFLKLKKRKRKHLLKS